MRNPADAGFFVPVGEYPPQGTPPEYFLYSATASLGAHGELIRQGEDFAAPLHVDEPGSFLRTVHTLASAQSFDLEVERGGEVLALTYELTK